MSEEALSRTREHILAGAVKDMFEENGFDDDAESLLSDIESTDDVVLSDDGTASVRVGFGSGELYDITVKRV